jgi:hemoglobin
MRADNWRWGAAVVILLISAGCRAPFARHEDRKYEPPPRNRQGSPDILYNRLGGEKGIRAVVDGLVARALTDPKVNFTRAGTPRPWPSSAQNIVTLKEHLVQYLSGATGGPQRYEGRDLLLVHQGMGISGRQFDAFAADLKATLDDLHVASREREDLLEIIAPTRSAIVEKP